jgi:hypothetical protein
LLQGKSVISNENVEEQRNNEAMAPMVFALPAYFGVVSTAHFKLNLGSIRATILLAAHLFGG